ncbi:MAG: ACT domain-containing protein [Candidatus Desulforudis sp.]|nr:ACT domain-containing protein [Desulforudis sp.]
MSGRFLRVAGGHPSFPGSARHSHRTAIGGIEAVSGSNRIIVTVLGRDRVGIIAGVAQVLAENQVNILDISQTILQEFFVMILVADMGGSKVDLGTLKELLTAKGRELGLRIEAQHEDAFLYMHRI